MGMPPRPTNLGLRNRQCRASSRDNCVLTALWRKGNYESVKYESIKEDPTGRNAQSGLGLGAALLEPSKVHEARAELLRANKIDARHAGDTLFAGKAASLEGDAAAAEKEWTKLLSTEKENSRAAQAHFGLAGLHRKQGKTAAARHEMKEFQRLQGGSNPPQASGKE